jgi:hypothetical protein
LLRIPDTTFYKGLQSPAEIIRVGSGAGNKEQHSVLYRQGIVQSVNNYAGGGVQAFRSVPQFGGKISQ